MEQWRIRVAGWKYKSIKFFDEMTLLVVYLIREPYFEIRDFFKGFWRSPATIFHLTILVLMYLLYIGASWKYLLAIAVILFITQVYRIVDSGLHRKYYKEQHYKPDTEDKE